MFRLFGKLMVILVGISVLLGSTLLDHALPIASAQEGQCLYITIHRNAGSLTLEIPGTQPASLAGLGFEVTKPNEGAIIYPLSQFPSLSALQAHIDAIPLPTCIRLRGENDSSTPPTGCLSLDATRQIVQTLSESEVFWFDSTNRQSFPFNIVKGADLVETIPAEGARFEFCWPVGDSEQPAVQPPAECFGAPLGLPQYALCPSTFGGTQPFEYSGGGGTVQVQLDGACANVHDKSADGMRLAYSMPSGAFGGWGVHWDLSALGYYDASAYSALAFWLRGATGSENFQVTVRDMNGIEERVELNQLAMFDPAEMTLVTVPFSLFPGVNKGLLNNIGFGFNDNYGAGNVCVDDLAFVTARSVATGTTINARVQPDTASASVAQINPGETVWVVLSNVQGSDYQGTSLWSLVILPDSKLAYIHSSLLEGDAPPPPPPPPPPTALTIAHFDGGVGPNQLGGQNGVFYSPPNDVRDSYDTGALKIDYVLEDYGGFWMKLNGADFSSYTRLTFDVRADFPLVAIKVEFKRANNSQVRSMEVGGIGTEWQPMSIDLAAFELSSLTDMSELVFVLERHYAGNAGALYLDNIVLRK